MKIDKEKPHCEWIVTVSFYSALHFSSFVDNSSKVTNRASANLINLETRSLSIRSKSSMV